VNGYLFNERVEQLTRSELANRMAAPNYALDYEKMMKREWISLDGVTEDAVNAFVLNIRPLVQDSDGFSIRRLANDVYIQNTVPADLRDNFNQQRGKWCEHKSEASPFKHFNEEREFTNGEMFDILMYGGLVHANSAKHDLFRLLTMQGAYSSIVCGSFLASLRLFLEVVQRIRDVNVELLKRGTTTSPTATRESTEGMEA